tara:strand:+ start:7500 stop:7820 length:321 start_codon:yes stop_codon:yes gene_type:complete
MDKNITDNILFIVKTKENYKEYDFLTYHKKSTYYNILNSQNDYQLKSLYEFIYKHYIYCKEDLLDNKDILRPFSNCDKINDNLKDFIDNNDAKEIFIINIIRAYFK